MNLKCLNRWASHCVERPLDRIAQPAAIFLASTFTVISPVSSHNLCILYHCPGLRMTLVQPSLRASKFL